MTESAVKVLEAVLEKFRQQDEGECQLCGEMVASIEATLTLARRMGGAGGVMQVGSLFQRDRRLAKERRAKAKRKARPNTGRLAGRRRRKLGLAP